MLADLIHSVKRTEPSQIRGMAKGITLPRVFSHLFLRFQSKQFLGRVWPTTHFPVLQKPRCGWVARFTGSPAIGSPQGTRSPRSLKEDQCLLFPLTRTLGPRGVCSERHAPPANPSAGPGQATRCARRRAASAGDRAALQRARRNLSGLGAGSPRRPAGRRGAQLTKGLPEAERGNRYRRGWSARGRWRCQTDAAAADS